MKRRGIQTPNQSKARFRAMERKPSHQSFGGGGKSLQIGDCTKEAGIFGF